MGNNVDENPSKGADSDRAAESGTREVARDTSLRLLQDIASDRSSFSNNNTSSQSDNLANLPGLSLFDSKSKISAEKEPGLKGPEAENKSIWNPEAHKKQEIEQSQDRKADTNKDGSKNHLTEQQEKDAQVRKGEGPYQVAARLLGKGASHEEKMALAMALKEQYKKETDNKDPQMRGLKVGHSLLNESNFKSVLDQIKDKSMHDKIAGKLDKGEKPGTKPEPEKPKPGQEPEKPKPGQEPEKPKPGQEPEKPKPGQEPEKPKPGQEPEKPKPGQEPEPEKPKPPEDEKAPDFRGKGGPAAIRYNNPGAMYPGESSRKFGSTEYHRIGGGHLIAEFKDAVSGAAAQFDLLASRNYANMSVKDAVGKWSAHTNDSAYHASLKSQGIDLNAKVGDIMKDKDKAIALAKAMAKIEAGKDYPLTDKQWAKAYDLYKSVNNQQKSPEIPGKPPEDQKMPGAEEKPEQKPDGKKPEPEKPPEEKKLGPLGSAFEPVDKPQRVVKTIASVYDDPQGTASGRYFNPNELTVAIKPELARELGLKFGDVVRITRDGKTVDAVYTDAGPFVKGRGIDLSAEVGRRLGITVAGIGVGEVSFQKIGREPGYKDAPGKK